MYTKLTDGIEVELDEADRMAGEDSRRMNHEEVFGGLRKKNNGEKGLWQNV